MVNVPLVGFTVFKCSSVTLGVGGPNGPTFTVSVTLWPSESATANVHVPGTFEVTLNVVDGPGPAKLPTVATLLLHVSLTTENVPVKFGSSTLINDVTLMSLKSSGLGASINAPFTTTVSV